MFVGPSDFSELAPVSRAPLAMHPAFSPKGGLAYAGSGRGRQRVYVDGKPVSPAGLTASAPVFCRHPDGARLVYGVELGAREDLLVADDRGREPVRIALQPGLLDQASDAALNTLNRISELSDRLTRILSDENVARVER